MPRSRACGMVSFWAAGCGLASASLSGMPTASKTSHLPRAYHMHSPCPSSAAMCSTTAQPTRPVSSKTPAQRYRCRRSNVSGAHAGLPAFCLRSTCRRCLPACLHSCPFISMSACRLPPRHTACPYAYVGALSTGCSCPAASRTGELRYQELTDPSNGIPPYLLAKGASAGSFQAGAPMSAWGPQLPGYDRSAAGGLYGQPGTPCPDRLL